MPFRSFVSRHVLFDENNFPFKSKLSAATDSTEQVTSTTNTMPLLFTYPMPQPTSPMPQPNPQPNSHPSITRPSPITQPTRSPSPAAPVQQHSSQAETQQPPNQPTGHLNLPTQPPTNQPLAPPHPMVTRTRDNTIKPKQFPNHIALLSYTSDEPKNFTQAQKFPHWCDAMTKE